MSGDQAFIDDARFESLMRELDAICTIAEFRNWARGPLRAAMPHEALACVFCRAHAGGFNLDYVLTVDFPTEHFDDIRNAAGGIDTPIARRWLSMREPQIFNPDCPWPESPKEWLAHFRRNRLGHTITHAFIDDARSLGSYFGFHRLPESPGEREAGFLRSLIPRMHPAFLRAIAHYERHAEQSELLVLNGAQLSHRESDVARFISHSKSNAEIAHLLALSENTVKHHVTRILEKTGCSSRAGIAAAVQRLLRPVQDTRIL